MIEAYQEEFLYSGKSVAGAIFSLKNNYDWKDKTETELSGEIKLPKLVWSNDSDK